MKKPLTVLDFSKPLVYLVGHKNTTIEYQGELPAKGEFGHLFLIGKERRPLYTNKFGAEAEKPDVPVFANKPDEVPAASPADGFSKAAGNLENALLMVVEELHEVKKTLQEEGALLRKTLFQHVDVTNKANAEILKKFHDEAARAVSEALGVVTLAVEATKPPEVTVTPAAASEPEKPKTVRDFRDLRSIAPKGH